MTPINEPAMTITATIALIFADATAPDATDSTIDDCIADIIELHDDERIDRATADDFIAALHRITELEHL